MKTLITNSLFWGKYPFKIICHVGLKTEEFYKLSEKYFNDKKIKTRREHNFIHFYFQDDSIIDTMKKELAFWITEIYQPVNLSDKEFLLSNPKKVLCDLYPKEKYRYCVYLKCNMPATKKQSFYDWFIRNNDDKISIPGSTLHWLLQKKRYGEFYIRVEDEKTLLLVNIFLSEYVKKTTEYVLRDSINIKVGTPECLL